MQWKRRNYVISDGKKTLDVDFIHRSLITTYWAQNRTKRTVKKTIENSLCFGVYLKGRQIGFCRAVTDYCTFTWVADVFIDPAYRGKGLGVWLMKCFVQHPKIKGTMHMLGTKDAHALYEKVGFIRQEAMVRRPK